MTQESKVLYRLRKDKPKCSSYANSLVISVFYSVHFTLIVICVLRLGRVLRVNGPIFPDVSSSGDTTESDFFRLEPSQFSNGCFIARLSRQVRVEEEASLS